MPTQLAKGTVFNPGDIVDAADLNNLVDNGTALVGLITEQGTPVTAAGTDQLLLNRGGALKRANVSTLPQGVTSIGMTVDPVSVFSAPGGPFTTAGTFAVGLKTQIGNKILASPADGLTNTPGFRTMVPKDLPDMVTLAAHDIDCRLGNFFFRIFDAGLNGGPPYNLNLKYGLTGQTVTIWLQQPAAPGTVIVNWQAPLPGGDVRWRLAVPVEMTMGAHKIDIFTFRCIGSELYFGHADQNYA